MTDRSETSEPRRLACASCGVEYDCSLAGGGWCADESFRLPMPADASDCLCPDGLRKLAKQQQDAMTR
jgi:hypothetical protein